MQTSTEAFPPGVHAVPAKKKRESLFKCSGANTNVTALDWRQMTAILLAQLNEATLIGLPYLIGVYMVRDWLARDRSASEEEVGRMTGFLAASFCCAQFLSSMIWGCLSDRIGRKWLIVMSNVTSTFSVIVFGLAPSYWIAFAARCLGGFFNCTFVNVKAMIGDFTDASNQDIATSYLGVAVGLGSLLAPVIGGGLAKPCERFGSIPRLCGPNEFLEQRPYFLPCFAVALMSLAASCFSLFLLQETLPSLASRKYQQLQAPGETGSVSYTPKTSLELVSAEEFYGGSHHSANSINIIAASPCHTPNTIFSLEEPGTPWSEVELEPMKLQPLSTPDDLSLHALSLANPDGCAGGHAFAQGLDMAFKLDSAGQPQAAVPWYASRQVLLTLAGYGLAAFGYNIMDELVPLYASAPVSLGGLGLASSELALPLVAAGPVMIVWSIWGFPRMQRALKGALPMVRLSILLAAPLMMLIPLSSLASGNSTASMGILAFGFCFIRPVAASVYACCMLLINTAGPRANLGAINGLGQATVSISKALGPFVGGLIWGASLKLPFAGHQFLVFAITSCILLLVELVYIALRP